MAKRNGTTKYVGAGASAAANSAANGGGKYDYVEKHLLYSKAYKEALNPKYAMKEAGEEVKEKLNISSSLTSNREVTVDRIGKNKGTANIVEYIGNKLFNGEKVAVNYSNGETALISKTSNGYVLKSDYRNVKAKTVEAITLYVLRGTTNRKIDGKYDYEYYKKK